MIDLTVGMLLQFSGHEYPDRLLWIEQGGDNAVVIDTMSPKALPVYRSVRMMAELLASGECHVCDTDPWAGLGGHEDAIPDAHRDRRDKCWALIRPLIFDQPAIFTDAGRGRAFERVMAETGANNTTGPR